MARCVPRAPQRAVNYYYEVFNQIKNIKKKIFHMGPAWALIKRRVKDWCSVRVGHFRGEKPVRNSMVTL